MIGARKARRRSRPRVALALCAALVVTACSPDRADEPDRDTTPPSVPEPPATDEPGGTDVREPPERGNATSTSTTSTSTTSTSLPPLPTIEIQASPAPGGFAEQAGLTGGRGQPEYVVTSVDDDGPGTYRDAVSEGGRYVRFDESLNGRTIELRSPVLAPGSDLTLDGSGVDVTISNRATRFSGTNVVVAGLRFAGMDGSGNEDALTFLDPSGTQVFGVYGNVFERATDGLIDVIWNRGHDVHGTICGNLIQHHDKAVLAHSGTRKREGGTFHLTMCRNHWLDVYQRTPFTRDALVHQYNSVFERYGKPNGDGGGSKSGRGDRESEHLLENNVAVPRAEGEQTWEGERVRSPRTEFAGPQHGSSGKIAVSGSLLETTGEVTATAAERDPDEVFEPPYGYDLVAASAELRDVVRATAGTCEPSGRPDAVVPCAPLLLLRPGEAVRASVDGDVADVVFLVDGSPVDGAARDGDAWSVDLDLAPGAEIHRVRAAAVTPDGRTVESAEILVGVVSG